LAIDPTITPIDRSIACNPRAITVLVVPLFLEMEMPPMALSTALSNIVLMASYLTIVVRGKH